MLSIAKLFLISVPITTFLYIFISDFSNSDLKNVERNNNLHGNFLHITDFHPDPHYMTNTTAKSRCHGHSSRQSKPKHMLKGIAGSWGATATICDSPMSLINATFEWLENNWKDKLDFVIWTGDNSRHDNDDNIPRSPQEIFELNQMITEKFLKTFANTKKPHKRRGPRFIPIVPSIGNNDIHPNNILPPGPNDMLKILHDIWDPFIPNNQRESFLRGGYYYTEVIPKKLLVISLNTLYFYNANTAVNGCKYPGQPGTDEIKWLNRILKKARKNNMKVYLTGHVAPRRKQYTRSCYKKYGKLALKYNDIILGHYYGHSNMDHFFFIGKNDNRSDEEVILAENREDCNLCDQTYAQQTNTQQTNAQQIMSSNLDKKNKGNTIDKYLDKLLSHYQKVPSGSPNDFAVVHINPSIIPVFYPALRIIKYNTTEVLKKKNEDEDSEDGEVEDDEGEDDDEDEEDYYDDDDNEEELLKKGKKGSRKRKPNPHSPSHTNTFLTPLGYTQYFINLTEANKYPNKTPEFQVEYTTWDDYNMKDLTVPSWIQLARKLANHGLKGSLWKKFREHLMVGTRSILKQKSRKIHHQDCIYTKCNAKGPEDYLVTEIES